MITNDPTQLSLSEAAGLIARRELSPLELTEACITRSEAFDGKLKAYITPTFDSAREEARVATQEIAAGQQRSPLHGIPFALKDLYETAGILTTAGSRLREEHVPLRDGRVVSLLKQAGVVLLGKLTMHELALGGTNINSSFPTPSNPWNLERITGGSSGGSGAAISAGLCLGSLGSDTRGSIRLPASLCGITGLKPTYGRISIRGVVPLNWSLDHPGPMARTASDCALILQAIAGYDDEDPTSVDLPVPDYSANLHKGIKGLRIGMPTNFFFDQETADPEVVAAVRATGSVFASLGADVKDIVFPEIGFEAADVFLADAAAYHEGHISDRPEAISASIRGRLNGALNIRGVDYSRARFQQLELKLALRKLFREVDIILTPTVPVVAPTFAKAPDLSPSVLLRNTGPFNVAGIPTISLPCGFDADGLPIGVSLAGRLWEDDLVLHVAHAYQQMTDWHSRRPPLA